MSEEDAADESTQVRRARRKLLKQLASEDKQITPQALQRSGDSVRQWITRHSKDRINLRDKTFRLFDENQHPEESKSEHVRIVQQRVATSMRSGHIFPSPTPASTSLEEERENEETANTPPSVDSEQNSDQ